jgi:putative membrane protein
MSRFLQTGRSRATLTPNVAAGVLPERTAVQEPDYRFTLANERTFLAWVRTALALLAGAIALGHLVPGFGPDVLRKVVAVALGLLGVLAAATSVLRWRRVQRAMDADEPLPRARISYVLATLLTILAVAATVIVLLGDSGGSS